MLFFFYLTSAVLFQVLEISRWKGRWHCPWLHGTLISTLCPRSWSQDLNTSPSELQAHVFPYYIDGGTHVHPLDNSATRGSERLKDVCSFTQLISAPSNLKMTSGYTELTCGFHWVNTADIGKNKAGVVPWGENSHLHLSPSSFILTEPKQFIYRALSLTIRRHHVYHFLLFCKLEWTILWVFTFKYICVCIYIHTHIYISALLLRLSLRVLLLSSILHFSINQRSQNFSWGRELSAGNLSLQVPHFLSWSPLSWPLCQHLSSDQPWNSFKSWPLSSRF